MNKRDEQILTWGGIIVLLILLAFGFKRGADTYIEGDEIMGPQLGGFPGVTVLNPDYQLGDIRIERAMDYAPRGSCGCAEGAGLILDPAPIIQYLFPPYPSRDFEPVIPKGPPPMPKITVYKDRDYSNKALTFYGPVSNMETTGLGLNDGTSSIRVVGKWEVFEHAYFQGQSRVVDMDIPNLHGSYFQDRISSMRPVK